MSVFHSRLAVVLCFFVWWFPVLWSAGTGCAVEIGPEWEEAFHIPPPDARPWVYWFWVHGNVTREGITADLEAMQRAGVGGVLIMEVIQSEPDGPVRFAGPQWQDLFQFACAEADHLGLQVNLNNSAGWAGSGGPWITPELSMQKIVWTETAAEGPNRLETTLPAPPAIRDFYRDIKILAYPTPAGDARIENLAVKTALTIARPTGVFPVPADWPEPPPEQTVPRVRIVDLTSNVDAAGKLTWDVPEGKWTILRLGCTTTGAGPAPGNFGLECDKMSRTALEVHFANWIDGLLTKVGPLAGKSLIATHIDSWESGSQNWTPRFREEFQRRRGYDLIHYLPVIAGRIVQSRAMSERFLWDFRQTINELVLENYAGHFRELARRRGLRLTTEAYTTCPCDELSYGGRPDEPMAEFWTWPKSLGGFSVPAMTSAGHVWGKRIIGAEAFTADNRERWLGHPAVIKEIGDWAFCEGVNRFAVHRYAMQPWSNVRPGMGMGWWGLHYERTQTWWDMASAWHAYLSRCQHLLRQGLFTADVCYLGGEGMPQSLARETRLFSQSPLDPEIPRDRTGYNFDVCPPDALLERMSVRDGRLVLPDGMSYRLLVLPMVETMTPRLLAKIKELIEAGATVVGSRPAKSPSLNDYPRCDHEVKRLAEELWGSGDAPAQLTERRIGKGRLFWSAAFQAKPEPTETPAEQLGSAQWIWHPDGDTRWALPAANCYFRRVIDVNRPIQSARLIVTADDGMICWVNGRLVGSRDNPLANFRFLTLDVGPLLKPGKNLLAVEGRNGVYGPNPAGLIAALRIEYRDGSSQTVVTDKQWESAQTVPDDWNRNVASGEGWTAAREFGPLTTPPWQELAAVSADTHLLPEEDLVNGVMMKLGVPPDFDFRSKSGVRSLRFTHRTLDGADLYFVANKLAQPEEAVCAFRVQGRRPELWHPDSGRIECPAVYDETHGVVRLPIAFEPSGSVFVVFRKSLPPKSERIVAVERDGKEVLGTAWTPPSPAVEVLRPVPPPEVQLTVNADRELRLQAWRPGKYFFRRADGSTDSLSVDWVLPPKELTGPWDVRFPPGGGAPATVVFDKLISWSEHTDPGIKYFSGTAVYRKTFDFAPRMLAKDRRWELCLGDVQVMADVTLNGQELGILWKPPYRLDVTEALRPGENRLEIRVVNLWANRQIGDEFLPEDSDRNGGVTLNAWPKWLVEGKSSPTGRHTFATWRLWQKNDPLQPSGLLGPVRIIPVERRELPEKIR